MPSPSASNRCGSLAGLFARKNVWAAACVVKSPQSRSTTARPERRPGRSARSRAARRRGRQDRGAGAATCPRSGAACATLGAPTRRRDVGSLPDGQPRVSGLPGGTAWLDDRVILGRLCRRRDFGGPSWHAVPRAGPDPRPVLSPCPDQFASRPRTARRCAARHLGGNRDQSRVVLAGDWRRDQMNFQPARRSAPTTPPTPTTGLAAARGARPARGDRPARPGHRRRARVDRAAHAAGLGLLPERPAATRRGRAHDPGRRVPDRPVGALRAGPGAGAPVEVRRRAAAHAAGRGDVRRRGARGRRAAGRAADGGAVRLAATTWSEAGATAASGSRRRRR